MKNKQVVTYQLAAGDGRGSWPEIAKRRITLCSAHEPELRHLLGQVVRGMHQSACERCEAVADPEAGRRLYRALGIALGEGE